MNQAELRDWLKANVDWDRFFSLVNSIGDQCNDRKARFDKSDLFEKALEIFSDGKMKWVDEKGFDHELKDQKIEFKFRNDCLRTKVHRVEKEHVDEIRLTNTLAGGTERKPETKFDHLLICDRDTIAVVEPRKLWGHIKVKSDSMVLSPRGPGVPEKMKLPTAKLEFVVTLGEFTLSPKVEISYMRLKRDMQNGYLSRF